MKKDIKIGSVIKYSDNKFYQIISNGPKGTNLYWFSEKKIDSYKYNIDGIGSMSQWSLATKEEIAKLKLYIPLPNSLTLNYLIL